MPLDLIQYFTHGDNSSHEAWFILIHVDIEARAAEGIGAIIDYFSDPTEDLSNCLSKKDLLFHFILPNKLITDKPNFHPS